MSVKADERDIFELFSGAGEITDIRLITDRHTRRSKGLAYVEFAKADDVFAALALTGQPMRGAPVMVKPAEAEKNLAWEAPPPLPSIGGLAGIQLPGVGALTVNLPGVGRNVNVLEVPLRLCVSGFKRGLGEPELRQLLEPFGKVDAITIESGGSGDEGSAVVVFASAQEGTNAMAHWHGKIGRAHV